jgi:MFS family permease
MIRTWLPRWDGLPPTFWILWAGTFVNRLGGFVIPFLSLYLTAERQVPLSRVGVYVALFGAGQLGAGPAGGWLADRFGRRPTLLVALCLGAASMLQLGFARAPWHLAFGCFALGFFGDMYRPASNAAVADIVPPLDRTRAYGLMYWVVNLAFAISAAGAGLLSKVGYLWLFVGDAVTTLAFAVIVLLRLPETRPASPSDATAPESLDGEAATGPSPWRNGPYLAFCALTVLVTIVFQQGFVAVPIDMRAHGVPPSQFGALIAINGVLIVLIQPFVVMRVKLVRASSALAIGALLTGLGFGANALSGTALLYALAIVIWTLGEIVTTAVSPAVVAAFAPSSMRGRYQGVFQMSWGASALAGPIFGTWLLEHTSSSTLWASCLAIGVVAALGNLALGTRVKT